MNTLLLAQDTWDLILDAQGNIAVAADPYAAAQDVASEGKVFLGEMWFDDTRGIPYLSDILGFVPNMAFIKSQIEQAALRVPRIVQARGLFASIEDRVLTGQVQVIDVDGQTNNVSF